MQTFQKMTSLIQYEFNKNSGELQESHYAQPASQKATAALILSFTIFFCQVSVLNPYCHEAKKS